MEIYNSRILIVDDEPRWANKIAKILTEQGYNDISIMYGITKFSDLLNNYDMAILDIKMPGFDGFQIKNYLQQYSQNTGVILTSQFENYGLDLLKKAKGSDGWITKKDIEREMFSFIMLVNKILEQKSEIDSKSCKYELLDNIILDNRNEFGIHTRQQIQIIEILKELKSNIIDASESNLVDYSLCIDALVIALSKRRKDTKEITYAFNNLQYNEKLTPNIIRSTLIEELEKILSQLKFLPKFLSDAAKRVFIVHGHDEEAKQTVARFMYEINLSPVILSEQPNFGRTIIEKFEQNADVSFAVILLTPDDCAHLKNKPEKLHFQARQNLILELGYFMGRLGRNRVCALYKEGVETPSDIHGVIYIQMDSFGGWKMKLAEEIKYAGLTIKI